MTKSFTTYITFIRFFSEIFGRKIMADLIYCKKQSHDTNTANFFKSGEGYTLNNRRSHTGDAMQQYIKSAIIFLPNISEKIFYQYKLKEKKEN
jgi:hypothetical protein